MVRAMPALLTETLPAALHDLDPADIVDQYHRRGLDDLDDATLLAAVAGVVAVPRWSPPDSFILHAPLEVLARTALLQHCSPAVRSKARQRLVWVAARYEHADRAAPPASGRPPTDQRDAARRLVAAIEAGELDDAQRLGAWLGADADPAQLARLVGDTVVPALGAAAHGPIFLQLLPRVAARTPQAGALFGTLARELARDEPDTRIRWVEHRGRRGASTGRALGEAIAEAPVLGLPASTFIRPIMEQVDGAGPAAELLGPAVACDPLDGARALLRISTESMLLDDPAHAPYGWSHCLTMPLAVTAVAPSLTDPSLGLAVAATHVLGFRTALGSAPLAGLRQRPRPGPSEHLDLRDEPAVAAATVLAADAAAVAPMLRAVVDLAAIHPDAHLAKYVVACLEAARFDPAGARQHLAAAAHLAAWWVAEPVTGDPLISESPTPSR